MNAIDIHARALSRGRVAGVLLILAGLSSIAAVLLARGTQAGEPTSAAEPSVYQGIVYFSTRSTVNYDLVEAQIGDEMKFAQGDLTGDVWVEFGADGSILRLKGVTRDRLGNLFQENLLADGIETVTFYGSGPRGKTCTDRLAWDSSRTSLGNASPEELAASDGYRPVTADARDLAAVQVPPGREAAFVAKDEFGTMHHVVVVDAADGWLYADLVWQRDVTGKEVLRESRVYNYPTAWDDGSVFTIEDQGSRSGGPA